MELKDRLVTKDHGESWDKRERKEKKGREFNWSARMVGDQGIKGDKGEKGESEALQAQCHTPTGNNACGKI